MSEMKRFDMYCLNKHIKGCYCACHDLLVVARRVNTVAVIVRLRKTTGNAYENSY